MGEDIFVEITKNTFRHCLKGLHQARLLELWFITRKVRTLPGNQAVTLNVEAKFLTSVGFWFFTKKQRA